MTKSFDYTTHIPARKRLTVAGAVFAAALIGGMAQAEDHGDGHDASQGTGAPVLTAAIFDASSEARGTATVSPLLTGGSLITLDLTGLPPGAHGVHLHETGSCEAPEFTSAGAHIAGGHEHGVMGQGGAHPGDLPNLHVPENGALKVEYFAPTVSADLLMDGDGAAIVIHQDPDDYTTPPTGNSGARIACGAFAAE